MKEFKNAVELLTLCTEKNLPISEIMRQREIILGETTAEDVAARMARVLEIMKDAAFSPIEKPVRSMGGLIGGEAKKLYLHQTSGKSICGNLLDDAITYAMATLETNASMGLIVASPTAGSAGIVPGLLLAVQKHYHFSDEQIQQALFNAGAIGYLAMRNATVAGAVGGCQAETGIAAAMAASAATELLGGTPKQCTYAASTVLMNMLGLVCDPVGGLVEYPCQNRNATGVANALVAAEMALAGITQLIPLDEMINVMYTVGKKLPAELRETALGGCATAPSACAHAPTTETMMFANRLCAEKPSRPNSSPPTHEPMTPTAMFRTRLPPPPIILLASQPATAPTSSVERIAHSIFIFPFQRRIHAAPLPILFLFSV